MAWVGLEPTLDAVARQAETSRLEVYLGSVPRQVTSCPRPVWPIRQRTRCVVIGTNVTPALEEIMSCTARHFSISVALATLVFSLFPAASRAGITLSGVAFIDGPRTNGVGVVSPAAIGAIVTSDGFKVSGIDLSYTTPGGEFGKNVSVSWIGRESLTAGPFPTPIMFTDHLDGSLTYTAGNFVLIDVTLRTITTATDYDLTTLHLGPISSGVPFDATVKSGPFTQPIGSDQLLQFFEMDFNITTNSSDTITIHLPSSAESSVTVAVPEPASIWPLLVAGLSLVRVRRTQRGQ
jgi:hypothetical protein